MPAPFRFLVIALGSHGDVHPLLGIALELRRRGHHVTFAASGYFQPLVAQTGLDFHSLGSREEFLGFMQNPLLWHPLRGLAAVFEMGVYPTIRPVYDWVMSQYVPRQTHVIAHPLAIGALCAQEKHGVPVTSVQLAPIGIRSSHDPGAPMDRLMYPWMPLWLKNGIWSMFDHSFLDRSTVPGVNRARADLGLPPVKRVIDHTWLSPRRLLGLWPEWFAPPQPDWPSQVRLTGFPLWDERSVEGLSSDLDRFLTAGEPPIAFTPGSAMVQGHRFFAAAVETCRSMNRRGLLLTRHPEQVPADLPPGVTHVPYAPFSQLLPRVAALVHHGGVGTTAQALAAGCPQLIMPMSHDQPDNARRVSRLGVGREILPQFFRPRFVIPRLRWLLDDGVRTRAREVADTIHLDHGIATAADVLEHDAAYLPAQKLPMGHA